MAGTTTRTEEKPSPKVVKHIIAATADASNGAVLSLAFGKVDGWIMGFKTIPGSPAPTAGYSVTLSDSSGVDVLGGMGAGRSASVAESGVCLHGGAYNPMRRVDSVLTFAATGNSVNSAVITFEMTVLLD